MSLPSTRARRRAALQRLGPRARINVSSMGSRSGKRTPWPVGPRPLPSTTAVPSRANALGVPASSSRRPLPESEVHRLDRGRPRGGMP